MPPVNSAFERKCPSFSSSRCPFKTFCQFVEFRLHTCSNKEVSWFLIRASFFRYLLGQGIGAIIFPPYSEVFGRKKLYVVSTALYSIACAIVASVHSLAGVVIGRFLSGFLSAIPTTVVIGSIEDMFNSKDRVWMLCCWAVVSNLGLIVGPIMATFVMANLGW